MIQESFVYKQFRRDLMIVLFFNCSEGLTFSCDSSHWGNMSENWIVWTISTRLSCKYFHYGSSERRVNNILRAHLWNQSRNSIQLHWNGDTDVNISIKENADCIGVKILQFSQENPLILQASSLTRDLERKSRTGVKIMLKSGSRGEKYTCLRWK